MNYNFENRLEFARSLDKNDVLAEYRNRFYFPFINGKTQIYFTGNSLGLQPVATESYINQELNDWKTLGVEGHFLAKNPWYSYHEFLRDSSAELVGAQPNEVVVMNSLTTNLHLLMVSFYRPTKQRYKIICEYGAFPSDNYALQSQASFHGFNADDAIVIVKPKAGTHVIEHEQILEAIEKNKDSLALVMIGGVNYYNGQVFNMPEITKAAHLVGATVGFDLAHATGNIKLKLHDWNVDFAVWCSYKYLNAGPGSVGSCFIHNKHFANKDLPRFAGWWGNDPSTRFQMADKFEPVASADAWQLSNAPVLSMAALKASLDIFSRVGMDKLIAKSKMLTSYLDFILKDVSDSIQIITPAERGCQLSVIIHKDGKRIHEYLTDKGVITDWREPDVMRLAPVPLYNSFEDVFKFGSLLKEAMHKI